ncbi:conjugal transfer protein TraF [Salmonella enterica subsp. enterica]|uniref:Conjugal transfer protein TraF n=1 Tax=Salmonella enterica subsp. enterica serovar Java TaxID=224729 RepID=A0A5X0ZDG4_SALEB|nr:conjugal transfer protein TraF [Salmonella enterica subsp. enterica serovar Java]EEP4265427.1 conjugal transfer protein TraF [Salmonella enterica subsp. enterica serovar Oranienburg]EEP8813421.1 conjugal transfer protein TraF [Salmonella enterica subsp. enterica serovar Oranienburg]EGO9988899.1 conjugal transfer protein TraF [Salmonella enterica]HAF4745026.1 conjugal transfer protein TraF [Salmonella enterica]
MGGTGVASSTYGAAALANPALMTHYGDKDDFSLILPSVGVQVSDPDHLQDGVDDVRDAWNHYDTALSAGTVTAGDAQALKDQLMRFHGTGATAQAGAGIVATVPNGVVPFAVLMKSWGTASVNGSVSDQDLQYLDDVIAGKITPSEADKDTLTSKARGRAAVVTDVGVALAREFESGGVKYSVGVTPKWQRVDTFNYNVTVKDYDKSDFDGNQYRNTTTGFNADIGVAADLDDNWTLGLAVQNIVPRSIDTREVNGIKETFKIRPQATAGVSWHNSLFTAAADVDLTPGSSFNGDPHPQYARVGGEFNAWSWAQVRAGYQQSLDHNEGSAFTAGIGISPFDVVHLDLTGLVGTDRTYGAVAQLSVTF